ncbi:MAG: AsmA-like C-terminal region-containing protein [Chitinispirillaceae bacterium]|jgi:hypothetical protein|nr:AsmA-like C-terminal region-containing protein [Chitinispirillaceae bacterium]
MNDMVPEKRKSTLDPVKIIEFSVAFFFLVVLCIMMAGLVPLSHPRITAAVSALAKHTCADSCAIGDVKVTFWKGISLYNVTLAGKAGPGQSFSMTADNITVHCNCLILGLHAGKLRRIIRDELPALRILARTDRLMALKRALSTAKQIEAVTDAAVANATVSVHSSSGPIIRLETMTGEIILSGDPANRMPGSLSAKKIIVDTTVILSQIQSDFSFDGKILVFSAFQATVFDGNLTGTATLNTETKRLSALSLSVTDADLYKCFQPGDTAEGHLHGTATLALSLDESPLVADSLRGRGTLSASHLIVTGFPIQRTLANMLVFPAVSDLKFSRFKADFSINAGKFLIKEAAAKGDSVSLKTAGWIGIDGQLNQKIECTLSPDCFQGITQLAQAALEGTRDGGGLFRLRVYGSMDNPKIELGDMTMLKKAVSKMFDNVKDNLMQWLK